MASADEMPTGTLYSIADQCGARDFRAWCRWIDEHCSAEIGAESTRAK